MPVNFDLMDVTAYSAYRQKVNDLAICLRDFDELATKERRHVEARAATARQEIMNAANGLGFAIGMLDTDYEGDERRRGMELRLLLEVDNFSPQLNNLRADHLEKLLTRLEAKYPVTVKHRRHRLPQKEIVPLTPEQLEAYELVSKHKGNMTAAARNAGKSRQMITKLNNKALKKLADAGARKIQTQNLPHDSDGQVMLADPRGPKAPRGRVIKKKIKDS